MSNEVVIDVKDISGNDISQNILDISHSSLNVELTNVKLEKKLARKMSVFQKIQTFIKKKEKHNKKKGLINGKNAEKRKTKFIIS